MKTYIKKIPWNCKWLIPLVIATLLLTGNVSKAQLPDCFSGTVMYGVFSPVVSPSVGLDSTEIRSIDYATGAIGPLMGGRRYFIRKTPGTTNFYGSSAMAVSPVTSKFYLITQMGTSSSTDGPKDIIMIDPIAPTATGTVIGTIGTAGQGNLMDEYHFVKTAISSDGFGYAIGVHRSAAFTPTTRFNPVIRFSLCGTANCSTVQLLGYLQNGGIMDGMNLFNGDIAFDLAGNLYFLAASSQMVGALRKYTDTRLFRVDNPNIPLISGTGSIAMSFVGDFNNLDSLGASGIAFDPTGNLYFSLRRYTNNDPTQPYTTELHKATDTGSSFIMAGFAPTPPNTSTSDLASCHFPGSLLSTNRLQLSGQYDVSKASLKWEVNNNHLVNYYEIQRSNDGINFTTINSIVPENTDQSSAIYQYKDAQNELGTVRYYRIRQSMKNGIRFYSNIVQVYLNNNINLVGAISPNPFVDRFSFSAQLKSPKQVSVRLADQSGRIVCTRYFNGKAGENKFTVNDISNLKKGIYFVEISVENEIIRDKVVRQ